MYKIRRPHIGAESDLFVHMITQSADRIGWDEVLLYQHTSGVILENHCKRANVVGDEQFWCPVLFNVIFCWVTLTVWKRFKMVDIQMKFAICNVAVKEGDSAVAILRTAVPDV